MHGNKAYSLSLSLSLSLSRHIEPEHCTVAWGRLNIHNDVIKWKHFLRYWPFVRRIHRSPVNSPRKGQWRGALMVFFICALNKRLSKQPWGWWFETPSLSSWRHCNERRRLTSIKVPIIKIRQPHDCLIFIMRIHIPGNILFILKWDPVVIFPSRRLDMERLHYDDVTTMASHITSLTVVYSTVYSDADERKHQSSASLAFVWGIHRDRWIPRTKGQLRGKCFYLMTSSCLHVSGPLWRNPAHKMAKMWRFDVYFEQIFEQTSEFPRFETPWHTCRVTVMV